MSSVPAFHDPFFVCRQECYFSLDDQCMKKCEKKTEDTDMLKFEEQDDSAIRKGTAAIVGGSILVLIGICCIVYSSRRS
jgi:hypothetical protein